MRLNNSEDTASKLVVSILDMESFFGFILSDSMIFNSFFNYTFICKKLVSELRRFGTTEFFTFVFEISNQLFLFCIDRDHRLVFFLKLFTFFVYMVELLVAIRMRSSFYCLPICL